MHISKHLFAFVMILQLLIWGTFMGFARTSFTWNGGTGSWHEASNWEPPGVPGAGDDVEIPAGFVSIGDTDVEVANLTFATGFIYAEGAKITITSSMTWIGGELMGDSTQTSVIDTLEIPANASLEIRGSGVKTLNRWAFIHQGTAIWQDQGVIRFTNNAVFENRETASFNISNDRAMSFIVPDGGTFKNMGTLSKTGGSSQSFISVHFENTGTVNVNSGTVQIDLTSNSITADFNTLSGTILEFRNGPHTLDSVSVMGGTMEIQDAQLSLKGDGLFIATTATVTMTGSESLVNGDGVLIIDGVFNWNRAEISGSGGMTINNILNIGGNSPKILGRNLDNLNTINWAGDGALRVIDNAHIQNQSGAAINMQDDALLDFFDENGGTFTNLGTVNKTGGNTFSTIDLPFTNQGIVNINASGLKLTRSITDETGIYDIAANSQLILDADAHEFTGEASISGAGTLVSTGGSTTIDAAYDGSGKIVIEGGEFSFSSPDTVSNLTQSGGILGGSGHLTVNGDYEWSNGTLQGSAGILLNGNTTISGTLSELKLIDGQTVTNTGTINYTGLADIRLANNAQIIIDTSAAFNLQTDADIAKDFGAPSGGSITNNGMFSKNNSPGTTTIEADFQNNGTLEIQSGTLNFNQILVNAVDGTLQGSAILNITNAVFNNNGNINPGTSPGILTIGGDYSQGATSTLNIEINGPNPGSGYDQLDVSASSVTLNGALNFTLPDNYRPEVTDVFEVLTYQNRNSQFSAINGPPDATFDTQYNANNLIITNIIMPNRPPVAVDDQLATNEDAANATNVLSNDGDPDNDPISLFGFEQPNNGTVTQPGDSVLSYSPETNFFGADSFEYFIQDNEGALDTAKVFVTINSVNDAPVVSGIPDVSFIEDNSNTLDLDPFVSDVDHSPAELNWTADVLDAQAPVEDKAGSDEIKVDPSDLQITIDPGTHVATFTATSDSAGIFTVKFTATDPSNGAGSDTIIVTVSAIPDPPLLVNPIEDVTYSEDGGPITVAADLNTVFENAEPVTMTFSATSDNPDITTAITGSSLSVNSTQDYFGSGSIVVIADNGSTTTANDTFEVTINPVNDAPVVALSDVTFPEDSTTAIDLDEFISDVDNDINTLDWSANILEAQTKSGSEIDGLDPFSLQISIDPENHIATFTATSDSSGMFLVEFIAVDPSEAAGKDTITVTVSRVLDPPQLTVALDDFTFTEDSGPVTVVANLLDNFFNPEPDIPLEYTVSSDNTDILPSVVGNTLTVNSAANFFGNGTITITASNGADTTAGDQFSVTVTPINDAPEPFLPNITFTENAAFSLDLDLFVNDVDDDTSALTWAAVVIDAQPLEGNGKTGENGIYVDINDLQVTIDPLTHVAEFTTTPDSIGVFSVEFTVTDTSGLSTPDTMTVTVTDIFINTPPVVVNPVEDVIYDEDSGGHVPSADLGQVFFDPDVDQTLVFSATSENSGIQASIDNNALIVTPVTNF